MAKVLAADDDPAIRQLLSDVLELDGHDVHAAVEGADGLRAYASLRPDFVVLDVMMPQLDGYEVLRRIRDEEKSTVPVLLLTAAPDCAARGGEIGASYYLAKPFAADEVLYLSD